MVAATFRPEGVHTAPVNFFLWKVNREITMISYAYMEADPDFPRVND